MEEQEKKDETAVYASKPNWDPEWEKRQLRREELRSYATEGLKKVAESAMAQNNAEGWTVAIAAYNSLLRDGPY